MLKMAENDRKTHGLLLSKVRGSLKRAFRDRDLPWSLWTKVDPLISDFWNDAYEHLRASEKSLINDYESVLQGQISVAGGSTTAISCIKVDRLKQMETILLRWRKLTRILGGVHSAVTRLPLGTSLIASPRSLA